MNMQKLTPNLMVENVSRAISFYRDLLDFELIKSVPDEGELHWALLKNGAVEIMLQQKESFLLELPALRLNHPGATMTLYIDVTNVRGFYERVKTRTRIERDLYQTSYGTLEFAVCDNSGYILVFAEQLPG